MALKQPALIIARDNRKKKKEKETISKPIKEVVKNSKGTTYINRAAISTKPSTQKSTQNRVVTNKERLTSQPSISNIKKDTRTIKTGNKAKHSIQTVDVYEKGGKYYYKDGKKEKQIDTKFIQNALKNNRSGVIGRYDSKGKLRETDENGNVRTFKGKTQDQIGETKKQLSALGNNIKRGNFNLSQAITDIANVTDAASKLPGLKQAKGLKKTIDNTIINATHGIGKGVEGLIDLGGGIVGLDTSKDLVRDLEKKLGYSDKIREQYEDGSLVKHNNLGGMVAQGGGELLYDVATGEALLKGLSIAGKAGKLGKIGKYIGNPETITSLEGLTGINKAKALGKNLSIDILNKSIQQAPVTLSVGGRAFEESSASGASKAKQREYAAKRMGLAFAVGNMFNGIPGLKNDKGFLDRVAASTIGKPIAKLTEKIPSEKLANGINFALKSTGKGIGEGLEENLEGIFTAMLKNATYSEGEKYTLKEAKEDAIVAFILGGFFEVGNTAKEVELESDLRKRKAEIKEMLSNDIKLRTGLDNVMNRILKRNGLNNLSNDANIDALKQQLQQSEIAKQQQANEINQRVNSGEIDDIQGLALLDQVKDGTYQQNRNLEQIATQESQRLQQAAQQGIISQEEYTQGLQTLTNTVNQTREEINTPQQQETTNNQQESTQESTFNNETNDYEEYQNKLKSQIEQARKTIGDEFADNLEKQRQEYNERHQLENSVYETTKSKPVDNDKINDSFFKEHTSDFDGKTGTKTQDGTITSMKLQKGDNLAKVTYTEGKDKIWIDELYVKNQNQGYGSEIVNAIKDYANKEGKYVDTFKELTSANGFWDKALDRNNNVETNQNENIPATKSENVISEEIKPQNQNKETQQETTETQQQESKGPEILDKMPTEKKSIFNKLKEKYNAFRHHFTDHREAWYDLSRETRNPDINSRADAIDLANGKAQVDIGRAQIDYNGKRYKNFTDENGNKVSMSFEGAYDLYNKIPVKAKNEFLVHNLNIDRLNQGVNQFDIPIQESQAKLAELRGKYEDIDAWSENIYQYYRNLAQKLVDGGRLPQSKVNEWWETTPHYVHIQRDMGQKGNSGVDTRNGRVDSDRLIQKVKGGNYPILPIKQTSADFTRNSIEALQVNNLGKEYLKTVGVGSRADGTQQINDIDDIFGINQDLIKDDGKGNYTFVIYDKGIPVEVPISKDMYEGLKPRDIRKVAVTSDIVKLQREIITNKNPVFGFIRNPGKDLQAMLLYSKHPAYKSLSTYNKLFTERTVTKNKPFSKEEGVMPQEIVELYYDQGNQANSFYNNGEFESEKSKNKIASGVEKALSPVEKGANFMESMPRITEFWNTVQSEGYTVRNGEVISRKEAITQQAEEDLKNKKITQEEYNKRLKKAQKMKTPTKSIEQVLMEASHDAAEITVNFKRGGTWGKNLDKNFAVYSSPAIQGAAKFGRTVTEAVGDAKQGDFKAAKRLISRAAALGIAPALLSEAMYGDDDDYKDTQDYLKDQYYLIKKPNGKWLRIPKGREISTMQSLTRRTMDKAKGEKDAFKGYGSFAINQVGPTNPLESNFASPIISAFLTNRSWSGNPIVSDYMKNNFADEDQYNEKTDELSKWLGKKTGISPMKINYVLDQYSGGLGDVALPYITPKATNDAKGPISSILKNELTFDPANSSKSVSNFYDAKSEINKAFKKRNASDEDKVKKVYMGTISQSLFDLSTKKREIQMDKNLSKKEKYEQALDIQKKMNKLTSDAVKNLDKVDVGENTATIGGILLYKNKNSKNGWSQESEKATKNREKLGLSPEEYYYYKNEESYTPPGKEYSQSITSGKNAKYNIAIVDAFNFDPSDYLKYKYKLSKIRGDKDSRGKTIRYSARNKKLKYLNSLPISSVEKAYLMKQNDKYYKGSDYNLKKAISNSNLSNKEKQEIYSYLKLGR